MYIHEHTYKTLMSFICAQIYRVHVATQCYYVWGKLELSRKATQNQNQLHEQSKYEVNNSILT